jgi:hypothetical protein
MMSHMSPYMNQVQVSANPCSSVNITIPLSTMAVPSQCMQQNILSFMIALYCIKLVTCEQKGSKNSPNLSCWNTLLTYFFQNIWTLPYFQYFTNLCNSVLYSHRMRHDHILECNFPCIYLWIKYIASIFQKIMLTEIHTITNGTSMSLGVRLSQNKAYGLQKPINKATTEAQNKTVRLYTKHQPVNLMLVILMCSNNVYKYKIPVETHQLFY